MKATLTSTEAQAAMEFMKARLHHMHLCNGDIMSVPVEERRRLTQSLENAGRMISRQYRIGGINKLLSLVEKVEHFVVQHPELLGE